MGDGGDHDNCGCGRSASYDGGWLRLVGDGGRSVSDDHRGVGDGGG